MTEPLRTLLREDADALGVPPAPAHEVLARGQAIRRRRRAAVAAGSAAAAVLAASLTFGLLSTERTGRGIAPVDPAPGAGSGPVFSIETTVYLDGGRTTAEIDDKAIKSLYYTSAGVVVRHGDNPNSDGGGPMRFSLVAATGAVTPLDVTFEETVPATDPAQPYLAYAEVVDGAVEVVLLDVRDGSETARIPVPGDLTWGGWAAPPVALSGDRIYVGTQKSMYFVDWRTGQVGVLDTVTAGYLDIRGGRAAVRTGRDGPSVVVDVDTGEVLLESKGGVPMLAPDGRYATTTSLSRADRGAITVHEVDTGSTAVVRPEEVGLVGLLAWAPNGELFTLDGNRLTTCQPDTGRCETTVLELDVLPGGADGTVDNFRLGGTTYES